MQKDNVSIIIPTYNRGYIIERAIQSILRQTYEAFELLIIDDGSDDDTQEVVKNISDERIRYIKCEKNRGPAAARNEGVRQSRYDYIAFHDSDDEWVEDKLEKQMQVLREAPADTGMVYSSYETDAGQVFPQEWVPKNQREGQMFPYLLRGNMIGTPTMLIRKACFVKLGGFMEELRCIEDYEFVLRFAREYSIAYIDEHLLQVHTTKDSVNYRLNDFFPAKLYIIDKWKKEMLQYGVLEAAVDDILTKAEQCGVQNEVAIHLQRILNFEVEDK